MIIVTPSFNYCILSFQ